MIMFLGLTSIATMSLTCLNWVMDHSCCVYADTYDLSQKVESSPNEVYNSSWNTESFQTATFTLKPLGTDRGKELAGAVYPP